MQNLPYENELDLHENEHVGTQFSCEWLQRFVLTHRQNLGTGLVHDSIHIDDYSILMLINSFLHLRASMPQSNCKVAELITKCDVSCERAQSQSDFDPIRSAARL